MFEKSMYVITIAQTELTTCKAN